MKYNRRMLVSVFYILLGVVLNACFFTGLIEEYWSGLGCGFIGVGVVQLIRQIRYRTNETYRDKVDTESKDERNKYLSNKAWAWAGYLYVILAALATIPLKIAGHDEAMMMASGSVCLIMLLYWGSWMYLRRKY